jgi:hypothetical protein
MWTQTRAPGRLEKSGRDVGLTDTIASRPRRLCRADGQAVEITR